MSISDIHLGCKSIPTESIINNLNVAIPDNEDMAKIDMIALVGDVTDEAIYLSDAVTGEIQTWMVRLLKICKKWDIVLFVLNGTPSHDRNQSKQFVILNTIFNIGAELIYVDTLSVINIEKLGISVLCVPDEWRGCNLQTQREVVSLLDENSLSKVDYAFMHGMFEYQTPKNLNLPSHNADFYLSIVKKYIFIGHIHTASQFDRILAQGSFDRLAHGQEEDKGYFHVEAYPDSNENDRIEFRVNKTAAKFVTVSVIGLTKDETNTLLQETILKAIGPVENYKIPINIRVLCNKNDINEDTITSYKNGHSRIKWTIKQQNTSKVGTTGHAPVVFTPTPINANTICSLMKHRLEYAGVEKSIIDNAINILNDLKNTIK